MSEIIIPEKKSILDFQFKKDLRPLNDNVILSPTVETHTQGGLLLPESAQRALSTATVLAVGPGKLDPESGNRIHLVDIARGDLVIYSKYAGMDYKHEGQELLIISEADIKASLSDTVE